MATPRNQLEIILLDCGFSKINKEKLKKIYIPINVSNSSSSECKNHSEGTEKFIEDRKQAYDEVDNSSKENVEDILDVSESKRIDYLQSLEDLCKKFQDLKQTTEIDGPISSDKVKKDRMYLFANRLPEKIRFYIFENEKVDVENWDSLHEGIMWLAWLRTTSYAYSECDAMQTAEYIDIINEIQGACISYNDLLNILHVV